jgi:hypothetical protein
MWKRDGRLGFPIWLPLLLGVMLFWAGHLLASEKHHARHRTDPTPVQKVAHRLVAV